MKLLGLTLAFIGIAAFEVPIMIKQKMWKELITFAALHLTALILCIAAVYNLILPSPTSLVELLFGPVSEIIVHAFK